MWWDDLAAAAKADGFDLKFTVSTHSNGCTLLAWSSNLTWDNHVRHYPYSIDSNYNHTGKDWWLVDGPKSTDPNKAMQLPCNRLQTFTTQAEADNAAHKGKRIDRVNVCAKSAMWLDGKTPRFIYAVPDKR